MTVLPTDLFRRNLIGLLVTTAALATLYLTQYRTDWTAYRNTVVPEHTAATGGTVSADGLTWSVESTRYYRQVPGYSFGTTLPEGTGAIVVTLNRNGDVKGTICNATITDGARHWKAEGIGFSSAQLQPGTTDNCSAPGPVQFTFVLPRDVRPTAVDVLDYSGQIMVRLYL